MARTLLTPVEVKGPFPGTVGANALDFAFAAADTGDGNAFVFTGREILVAHVPGGAAKTFTIDSVPDTFNREGDVTAYSVGAGEYAAFSFVGPGSAAGWQQSDGRVYIDGEDAAISFAILRV